MMKLLPVVGVTVCCVLGLVTVSHAQQALPKVNDIMKVDKTSKPAWNTIKVAENSQSVTVYSYDSKSPIGTLNSGANILVFGKNNYIATFAYNGQVAFVDARACEEKYPKVRTAIDIMNFPLPGTTLDDRLKENKNDLDTIKKDGSIPLYYGNDPKKAGLLKQQEEQLKQNQENGGSGSSGGSSSGGGARAGGGGPGF